MKIPDIKNFDHFSTGVLIPCLLNIWGVMLFLRISWVVAQAGIGLTLLIISVSCVVCVLTTLSLSAICTNGELKGGGVYYLVSRSLGAELGASVGVIFAFANAVAASMNTIGFCESLNELLKSHNLKIIDNSVNDTRIVGAFALLVMCLICAFGMDWETKTQNFLIVIIVAAIINYLIGAAIGPTTDREKAEGFQGISMDIASKNWHPDYRYSEGQYHGFFSVFTIYFPAVTGVQAGANICGDLKDPASAIPKGTLLAIAISTTSYLAMATLSGMASLRDASGNMTQASDPDTLGSCAPKCNYGLHNNYGIMQLMAFWGPLIYGGCWAATLSTALTNLLSVPRLIQALGVDRIYPGLIFFSKPYGKHGEPYRGYVLVFFVSFIFLLNADLNKIAPLITNFYLGSYALINFCTFHASFFKPISWRPSFRYYNLWLSLIGGIMCLVIMMIISWVMALITTFIFLFLYFLLLYRKPETDWGSSTDAQRYQETIARILQISHRSVSTKSYNPQLLVMHGKPHSREWLLDMAKLITSIGSFMIVADIHAASMTIAERNERISLADEWLRKRKLRAFYVLLHSFDLQQGILAMIQCAGLGHLAPNIMLIGYKYRWQKSTCEDLLAYYHTLHLGFEFGLAVAILRVSQNFRPLRGGVRDHSVPTSSKEPATPTLSYQASRVRAVMPENSDIDEWNGGRQSRQESEVAKRLSRATEEFSAPDLRERSATLGDFKYKPLVFHENSTLDAWWLYDDGGMNILLPYIIARRGAKEKMHLRVFVLPRAGLQVAESYAYMKNLLQKFRIEYSQLTLVEGINVKPAQSTWALFESMIKEHKTENDDDPCLITNEEYHRQIMKTTRHLRLRELVIEHSYDADLIVMTLPYPREDSVSAALYMAWLDIISCDLPHMMFVRGNQTSVIDA
ncbi:bumetanide-sensitive sodium-(potassium)-chloride cotransporter-like [Anticarsia gemmatalis]|uniref:bumetanide-sensitive sodium-(potassium)-chloride cotransporter-like n=1 Tax=Anticarsia gemmatalis TaxID=129554 RepID=UPI003F75A22D